MEADPWTPTNTLLKLWEQHSALAGAGGEQAECQAALQRIDLPGGLPFHSSQFD